MFTVNLCLEFESNRAVLIRAFAYLPRVVYSHRAVTQPADTEMLEEQPEQTEGEDLESQDGMLIKGFQ